jgi:thiol-disulfide isomerase/thioredoxin
MIERRRARRWAAPVLVFAVSIGCAENSPPPARDPATVDIRVVDRAGFDAELHKLRGQVVLVDFWAHWCEPCIEYFPHTVALADKHRDQGLAVVSVNMDAPEAVEQTLTFLRSSQAGGLTNLVSQYGGGSKSMEVFEIPNGALPCYKIYDERGQLRHTIGLDPTGRRQFSFQEVDEAVEMQLAE